MPSPDQNGGGAFTSLDRLGRAFRKSILDRHGRGQMEVQRTEYGAPRSPEVAGSRAGVGPRGGMYTVGGSRPPVQHDGRTESPADVLRLQRRQDPSLHRPESGDKSRRPKWRTLLSVAALGGFLVALARAIKCIHREVETVRSPAGSSSRRLGGGGGWECEEQENIGWMETGDNPEEAQTPVVTRVVAAPQTPLPFPGLQVADPSTRGTGSEGEDSGLRVAGHSEVGSTHAGKRRGSSQTGVFGETFLAHLHLLNLRAESADFDERGVAHVDFFLVAGVAVKACVSRFRSGSLLTVREKRFLGALQAILELEREMLFEEMQVADSLHSDGLRLMLETISSLLEQNDATAADMGSGARSGEASGSAVTSSSALAVAPGHAPAAEAVADFFWGNTPRVLAAIRQFSTTLRRLRKQERLLREGAFTQARVSRIRALRGELLDDVTICVSPGTEPLEHRVTFNYLDAYLLGLFRFFLSSELEFLQMFPDSALEDRISLLLDLVSQLSRDHRVPHPGP